MHAPCASGSYAERSVTWPCVAGWERTPERAETVTATGVEKTKHQSSGLNWGQVLRHSVSDQDNGVRPSA